MRVFILAILIVSCTVTMALADSYVLTDANGGPLGRLPYMPRGDEGIVPLSMLAKKAGWDISEQGKDIVVHSPGYSVTVRRGNPFAISNGRFVQLKLLPEEWDGSVWLPANDLTSLFGDAVSRDAITGSMQIRVSTASEKEGLPATSPQKSSKSWTLKQVIIDAGHGGKDPGAKGLYDLEEKTVTLDIAKRLAGMLKDEGIASRMTRTEDRFLELHERTKFANENQGDLFVSIHCNSFHNPNVGGFETYFLKPAKSERAVEAATRENSVVKLESGSGEYQDLTEENHILLTMATSQYMKDSEVWAANAIKHLGEKTGLEVRGVDQAGFYVLMGASMPAILVECGYLSNPDDAKLLATERGRQQIAVALLESVKKMKVQLESSASR